MTAVGGLHGPGGPVYLLLSRLDSVVRAGDGWRARCPSCGGRGHKLAVVESATGSALVICFGGCRVDEVVKAAGLQVVDLFPIRARPCTPAGRAANRRALASAALLAAVSVLGKEAAVVSIAASMGSRGEHLTADDLARLALAIERIENARLVFHGR